MTETPHEVKRIEIVAAIITIIGAIWYFLRPTVNPATTGVYVTPGGAVVPDATNLSVPTLPDYLTANLPSAADLSKSSYNTPPSPPAPAPVGNGSGCCGGCSDSSTLVASIPNTPANIATQTAMYNNIASVSALINPLYHAGVAPQDGWNISPQDNPQYYATLASQNYAPLPQEYYGYA